MADRGTGLDELTAVIDALLAVDVDALTDGELDDLVGGVQEARARLGAVAGKLIARWDTRQVWADDGSRSPAARLARATGCSEASAGVEVRRARQLAAMPQCGAALAAGEVSLDHVDLLGRARQLHRAGLFARDETLLVGFCSGMRFAKAARAIGYWCRRADSDLDADDGVDPVEANRAHVSTTLDGTVVIDGTLDPIGGAVFTHELGRLEHEEYLSDQRTGRERTPAQRRAAALVEMAIRSATAPADGQRPAPLFTVLLGDESFTHLCELANGTILTPRHLDGWLDPAQLETVLFDGPSTIISVSRQRSFTGALRRAIQVRDRNCQHSAVCQVPAEACDIDHITPHAQGGETSQFNGRALCSTHNRHPARRDPDPQPQPTRPIDRLDELRARLRWRVQRDDRADIDPALTQN